MFGNFVFDIDQTIAIPCSYEPERKIQEAKDMYGEKFFNEHCIYAYKYPHFIFPGYYELFRWLHSKGGKLFIFSTGINERNIELTEKFMKKAFGNKVNDIECKVFSREHCVDTTKGRDSSGHEAQSYFYGQLKKKISGIIVPESEISNTLLIDDDKSYMVKNEEYNFIKICCYLNYVFPASRYEKGFFAFHQAYFLAGILSDIFKIREEKKCSLVESAKFVQIDSIGMELNSDFTYPTTEDVNFFYKGLEILKEFNPELKFYYEYDEEPEPTKQETEPIVIKEEKKRPLEIGERVYYPRNSTAKFCFEYPQGLIYGRPYFVLSSEDNIEYFWKLDIEDDKYVLCAINKVDNSFYDEFKKIDRKWWEEKIYEKIQTDEQITNQINEDAKSVVSKF